MYSQDFKNRVLNFINQGGSKSEAARRYDVGIATIFRWLNQPKDHVAGKTGPKTGYRLDWNKLKIMVEAQPDVQQKELAHHFGVSTGAVQNALKALGFVRKKDRPLRAKFTRGREHTSVSREIGEA